MSNELTVVSAFVVGAIAAMVVVVVVLLVRLVRARRILRDAGVPLHNKAAYWGALIYTFSPVDLLPDPVYLDDIGILLLALRSLHAAVKRGGGEEPNGGDDRAVLR